MVKRGWVLFLCLLALAPAVLAEGTPTSTEVFSETVSGGFVCSESDTHRRIDFSTGGNKIVIETDVTVGPWKTTSYEKRTYDIFTFISDMWGSWSTGFIAGAYSGEGGGREFFANKGRDGEFGSGSPGNFFEELLSFNFEEGSTHNVRMVIDGALQTQELYVNGNLIHSKSVSYPAGSLSAGRVIFGRDIDEGEEGRHLRGDGWGFANMKVTVFDVTGGGSGSGGEEVIVLTIDGEFFTSTESTSAHRVDNIIPSNTPLLKTTVEFDFSYDAWRDDATKPSHIYEVIKVFSTPDGLPKSGANDEGLWLLEFGLHKAEGRQMYDTTLHAFGGCGEYGDARDIVPWSPGSYHVVMSRELATMQASITITKDGQPFSAVTRRLDCPEGHNQDGIGMTESFADGLRIQFGLKADGDNHHLRPLGFRYSNLQVRVVEGSFSGGIPTGSGGNPTGLPAKPAGGYEPNEEEDGEPVELHRADGQFFEAPFGPKCGYDDRNCPANHVIDIPTNGDIYEKFTVGFDFTTHDILPEGWYQKLLHVDNMCSGERFWRYYVKHPGQGQSAKSVLDPRGNPKWLAGDFQLAPNTQYRAEVTMDFLDEETYVSVFDSSGTLLQTTGDTMNNDPSNIAKMEATGDGFELWFGSARGSPDRIIGQPHFWKFANLVVTGVPFGEGGGGVTGPDGADLASDEGRLAFLAANLIAAAEEEDYSLDCGPSDEVVPVGGSGDPYCVLVFDDNIAFGTFGDSETGILESLQDPLFAPHIEEGDVDASACDGIDATLLEFQECSDAVPNMHVYAFVDVNSGTSFVLASKQVVDAFDTSILEGIIGFFQRLFGAGSGDEPASVIDLPVKRFHHGYFSQVGEKLVAATWLDSDARLMYGGFVTDFEQNRPADSEFGLGQGKQVIRLDIDPDIPEDVLLWRRSTAALRIADVEGVPIEGDYCGNGEVGVEEECEPGVFVGMCGDLYPEHSPSDEESSGENETEEPSNETEGSPTGSVVAPLITGMVTGGSSYLSDLLLANRQNIRIDGPWFDRSGYNGHDTPHDGAPAGPIGGFKPIQLKGQTYQKGVSFMPEWRDAVSVTWNLNGGYERLEFMLGFDDSATGSGTGERNWNYEWAKIQPNGAFIEIERPGGDFRGSETSSLLRVGSGGTLKVFGDGNPLFDSGEFYGYDSAIPVNVNVAGVNTLKIEFYPSHAEHPNAPYRKGLTESSPRINKISWFDLVVLADAKLCSGDCQIAPPTDSGDDGSPSSPPPPREAQCFPEGHEQECMIDVRSCLGGPGADGCFDEWTQPVSPNPCAQGDPACGAHHGGGDGGGTAPPPVPACPTEWETVERTGVYDIQVRRDTQGSAEIQFVLDGSVDVDGSNVCSGATPGVTANLGPHRLLAHDQTVQLYEGGGIRLRMYSKHEEAGTAWAMNGESLSGIPTAAGCWCNPSEDGSRCENLHLWIGTRRAKECVSENGDCRIGGEACMAYTDCCSGTCGNGLCTGGSCKAGGAACLDYSECCSSVCSNGLCVGGGSGGTCTGANGCCSVNQPCSSDAQCCGSNSGFFYCGGGTCKFEGGDSCFVAGTPILTPDGEVAIESLSSTSVVSSFDLNARSVVQSPVESLISREVWQIVHVDVEGLQRITTTTEHPFFTKNGWVVAEQLVVGDELLTQDNEWVSILSLSNEHLAEPVPVYNLHVADEAHNYFAGGVLVHNKIPLWEIR